jgi:ADP-ribose pyrophosphatase
MIVDEPTEARVTARSVVHEGYVWDVVSETFDYNDESLTRELIDHPGAVAVLAMGDDGRVLLIRQYRHAIRSRDWEIPAGLLDITGESPVDAAKRELAEEVDLEASEWHLLSDIHTSPGGSNEVVRIYLARGLSATADPYPRDAEEADIEKRWVPLPEAAQAALTRGVQNGPLIVAVLAAQASEAQGWATLGDPNTPWPLKRTTD